MSTRLKTAVAVLSVALLGAAIYGWWLHDAPRRASLASLGRLDAALRSGNRVDLLELLVLPAAIRNRTPSEQSEFLNKALHNEISAEGLAELRRSGAFGPLKNVFPTEAEAWARLAGVHPDDCVAYKLERNGVRAEVVLLTPSNFESKASHGKAPYRIVRVNNVRQLAESATISTTENKP
jgi:hypothetical protein